MENAPSIVLFWYLFIGVFLLTIALMIVSIITINTRKAKKDKRIQLLGKVCLILSIMCSIPIILVVVYVLYLYGPFLKKQIILYV